MEDNQGNLVKTKQQIKEGKKKTISAFHYYVAITSCYLDPNCQILEIQRSQCLYLCSKGVWREQSIRDTGVFFSIFHRLLC